MAALIIAIFPQNSSRGNWEEQQDRTDPNSQFELARKPAWLLAFRQFGLPKWKHDFESFSLWPLRYISGHTECCRNRQHLYSIVIFRILQVVNFNSAVGFSLLAAVQSLQSYHFYITVYSAFLTGFFPGYFFTFSFPVFLSASGFVSLLIVPERKKESFALAGPTSS